MRSARARYQHLNRTDSSSGGVIQFHLKDSDSLALDPATCQLVPNHRVDAKETVVERGSR